MEAALNGGRGRSREEALNTMGRLLANFPGNWVPATPSEWDGLARSMPAIDLAIRFVDPADWAAAVDARGRWVEYAGRLRAASGGRMPVGMDLVSDAGDVAAAFSRQVIAPAIATAGGCGEGREQGNWFPAAWALLWTGRSACSVARTSRAWHAARTALADVAGEGGRADHLRWPPAIDGAERDGVSLSVLSSAAELRAEGDTGRHCVAGYVGDCLSGKSRIVSLRRRDGTWLSTLEMRFAEDGPWIGQHRGRHNGDPSPEARNAAESYASGLRDGSVTFDASGLAALADPRPVPAAALSRAELARRVRAWDALLPGPLRGADASTLSGMARDIAATRGKWLWRASR